jgi:hypothetical protein
MIEFRQKTVRVYHTTLDSNIPGIMREGLLVRYYKKPSGNFTANNRARPFPEVIYLSKDIKHMIKHPEQGKQSIIVFDLPLNFYKEIEKNNQGDPIIKMYKNKEDFALNNVLEFMKLSPKHKEYFESYVESWKKENPKYKDLSFEEAFKKTPMYKGRIQLYIDSGPKYTIATKTNIPPEYISEIIDEKEYLKLVPNPNRLPK